MTIQHIKRVFENPKQNFFLFGPREIGKSTLVKRRFPNALIIDLLVAETRRRLTANPDRLLEIVRAEPNGQTIIIDEIQKVPELLSLVHLLIEEKRDWMFMLTGSSARKLKRTGVDLLGGRALYKMLHPFMAIEVKNGTTIHPQDLRPLKHFLEDYPEAKAICLYRGQEKLLKENILCMPCEEFLCNLQPNHVILQ